MIVWFIFVETVLVVLLKIQKSEDKPKNYASRRLHVRNRIYSSKRPSRQIKQNQNLFKVCLVLAFVWGLCYGVVALVSDEFLNVFFMMDKMNKKNELNKAKLKINKT